MKLDPRTLPKLHELETNKEGLQEVREEVQKLKLAVYDLLMAIQRVETNQQKLLFKKFDKES